MIKHRRILSWIPLSLSVLVAICFGFRIHFEETRIDLTQRKAELYYKIIYNADIAFVVLNKDNLIVAWNPGAEAIFGWKSSEVIGAEPDFLMPDGLPAIHKAAILKRQKAGANTDLVVRTVYAITKSGGIAHVRIMASSIDTDKGFYHMAILTPASPEPGDSQPPEHIEAKKPNIVNPNAL